jgi:hypothetical protein
MQITSFLLVQSTHGSQYFNYEWLIIHGFCAWTFLAMGFGLTNIGKRIRTC